MTSPVLLTQLEIVSKLIGAPYAHNGQDGFNCWTFTQKVQRDLFGRTLVDVDIDSTNLRYLVALIRDNPAHKQWKTVGKPSHGCVVEMSHSTHPHHIGTWLDFDGGGILHCQFGAGGSFDTVLGLQVMGWRRFIYYDWNG